MASAKWKQEANLMNFVQEELLSEGFRTNKEEVIEEGVKEYFQRKILPVLLGSSLIAGVAGIGGTVMRHNIVKTKENIQRLIQLKGAGNGRYSFTVAGKPAEYSEQTHLLKLNGKMEELGRQPAQNTAERRDAIAKSSGIKEEVFSY